MTQETELFTLRSGALIANRYQICDVLGIGGFAITYVAYDCVLQAQVAIKEYFPQSYAERSGQDYTTVICRSKESQNHFDQGLLQFKREAARTAQLKGRHNIVDVYDYCEQNATAYMIMEYLRGTTLTDYLRTLPGARMQDMEDVARIVQAVTEGLVYIHSNRMLHRDISPDNIILLDDGGIRLIDFGAAREAVEDAQHSVIVKAGCTPPEQYRRNGRQGPWTDIYALGATMYRMVTGSYPAPAPDRQRKTEMELMLPSEMRAYVPEYLTLLMQRCLALDPHLRLRSAEAVLEVLTQRRRVADVQQVAKSQRNRRIFCITGVVSLVALIVIGSIAAFFRSQTLYSVNLSPCSLIIELPGEWFAESDGLDALQKDFATLYPMVTLRFVRNAGAAQPALFPADENHTGCIALTEIRRLLPDGALYEQVVAYDTTVLYIHEAKAAAHGMTAQSIQDAVPLESNITESFEEFLDYAHAAYMYRGSIDEYRRVQSALNGVYALQEDPKAQVQAVALCISDGLSDEQELAALRLLLYLASERAQRILFLEHDGLVPAERVAREAYFTTYPRIQELLAEPIEAAERLYYTVQ